jgi:hypothetical protein
MAMDDVRVHYDSPRPSRVDALAYTVGTDIYLGPGQAVHLPHEAWHVVQQKQGRVAPTLQRKADGAAITDDRELEREADAMGTAAVTGRTAPTSFPRGPGSSGAAAPVIQRVTAGANDEWNSDIKLGQTIDPGSGYLRVASRRGMWARSPEEHAWVGFEAVAPDGKSAISVTADLGYEEVRLEEGHRAQEFMRDLGDPESKQFVGSSFTITYEGAEAALAKARQVKHEFDKRRAVPSDEHKGEYEDNPNKKYFYTASGRKPWSRTKYINCARFAAKLVKAAQIGNFLTRRRAGVLVHTPRGISLGLGREWKEPAEQKVRAMGSAIASRVSSMFGGWQQEASDPTQVMPPPDVVLDGDEPLISSPEAEKVAEEVAEE